MKGWNDYLVGAYVGVVAASLLYFFVYEYAEKEPDFGVFIAGIGAIPAAIAAWVSYGTRKLQDRIVDLEVRRSKPVFRFVQDAYIADGDLGVLYNAGGVETAITHAQVTVLVGGKQRETFPICIRAEAAHSVSPFREPHTLEPGKYVKLKLARGADQSVTILEFFEKSILGKEMRGELAVYAVHDREPFIQDLVSSKNVYRDPAAHRDRLTW